VELQGGVRVSGRLHDSTSVATFSTERMDYNLKTQDIFTAAPVELRSGGVHLNSESGLRANIKQSTVELESAHAQFTP
jgi:LPS export ABC transporter protein LptC